jgi:predicted GIY-YIG superfamily endonuclease
MAESPENTVVYCLVCVRTRYTYTGYTPYLAQRFRQHNGALVGGARSTTMGGPQQLAFYVSGFGADRRHARQLEWLLHDYNRKRWRTKPEGQWLPGETPVQRRVRQLCAALSRERFTATAPRIADSALMVHWALPEALAASQVLAWPNYIAHMISSGV